MAMASRVSHFVVFFVLVSSISLMVRADDVLTLDHSNLTEVVSKHDFIVLEFYAPWCGHCKHLAPEYEKAASVLKLHDPPLTLAKYDASDEANRDLATQFEIQGFPTIKILRNGGKIVQEYKGPREAEGIISYIKKQVGPASKELKSADDVTSHIDQEKLSIVGIFPKFSGPEFENFTILAEKLRSDYDFAHTSVAKILPKGGSAVFKPTIRLLKPFDELFADSKNFDVDAIEKFIEENGTPLVTIFDKDPNNQPYLVKFFNSPSAKAILIVDFAGEDVKAFKSVAADVAAALKEEGINVLLGDLEASTNILEYFGLDGNQAPLILVQNTDGKKYIKANLEADDIVPWLKDYLDGNVKPHVKSEPIPAVNDEPVKVVVHDTLEDLVLKSPKNVLIEFYAPWCGHCKKLAPILDEVAEAFEDDSNVVIAKLDATKNDFPTDIFDVQGFPTLYFKTASGKIVSYDGGRSKEDFIEFIKKNRDDTTTTATKTSAVESDINKDEL